MSTSSKSFAMASPEVCRMRLCMLMGFVYSLLLPRGRVGLVRSDRVSTSCVVVRDGSSGMVHYVIIALWEEDRHYPSNTR